MNSALWAAKTGLDAQNTRMTTISHNLANANTTGFKKERAVFEDLMYQNYGQVGAATSQDTVSPTGMNLGTGVRVVAIEKNYMQGQMTVTDNALDVAIDGRGFFQVSLSDGTMAYTRDGSFKVSEEGELVTSNGDPIQPPVSLPQGALSISIGRDGTITAQLPGQTGVTTVGTLQLTDFVNPAGLEPRGKNLLVESAASGPAQTGNPGINGLGSLRQGELEGSNVNVVEELVNMIETQRAYEMNSKAIATTDQMLQYVSNNL